MIVLSTLVRRWYAFAFIAGFFWAARAERDWKRALRFLLTAAFFATLAELSSTHTPFPYGRYEYIAETSGDEMYIGNVPLFVPLSFGVVVWAGRALAVAGFGARTSGATVLGGALAAGVIDLTIDPLTLRGAYWFLDPLYRFHAGGGWFEVPWSNLGGWILVSGVVLWFDELLEVGQARLVDPIRGPTLAFAIMGFFILVALVSRHWAILAANLAIAGSLFLAARGRIAGLLRETEGDAGQEPA